MKTVRVKSRRAAKLHRTASARRILPSSNARWPGKMRSARFWRKLVRTINEHEMAAILLALLWCRSSTHPQRAEQSVVIAIVDDGVDASAIQLRRHLAANPSEISENGIDDDHNGLVDDVSGYDFLDHDPDPRPADASGDPSHGTMMATVALRAACQTKAASNEGCGGSSVTILPLRVANERGV